MKKRWFALVACGVAFVGVMAARPQPEEIAAVKTMVLRTQRVEETVTCNGVVEAGEMTAVSPRLSCVLAEVLVCEGDAVTAGQAVARMDKEATRAMQENRAAEALALTTLAETITAPCDGIVLSVEARAGETVERGMPCVTLAAQQDLQVRVTIREKLLPSLAVGQAVRVSGAGFDRAAYAGRLEEISYAAMSGSSGGERSVSGVVSLDRGQADDSMRLGLSAKAKVIVSSVEDAVVIPFEATVQQADGTRAAYFVEHGRAKRGALDVRQECADGLVVSAAFAGRELVLQPDAVTGDGMLLRGVA